MLGIEAKTARALWTFFVMAMGLALLWLPASEAAVMRKVALRLIMAGPPEIRRQLGSGAEGWQAL